MLVSTPAPKVRNGAYYYDLLVSETTSHETTATVNDKEKLVFHDSYKYGSEVQFMAYSSRVPELKRRVDKENGWYRLECGYLPGSHETADRLRDVADKIDAVIGYSEPVVSYLVKPKEIKNLADVLI
jgi:hypothetical protein